MQTLGVAGRDEKLATFAQICSRHGVGLELWVPDGDIPEDLPENVEVIERAALADIPLILFLEPIETARATANKLGDVITGRHVVVHASRDLEVESAKTVSTILREETATHRIGFITGPMRSVDIQAGSSASATVYSRFPEVHEFLVDALVSPTFRLYRSKELQAAEIAAAYVRVIAFVWGVAAGMEQGASVGATLFARGLAEVARVAKAHGGSEQAVFGMSGAGNLFAEVQAPLGVEAEMGRAAVKFGDFEVDQMEEHFGVSARRLYDLIGVCSRLCKESNIDGRIVRAAAAMVSNEMDTIEAARFLMTLPVLDE